jgi:hypothetical protein
MTSSSPQLPRLHSNTRGPITATHRTAVHHSPIAHSLAPARIPCSQSTIHDLLLYVNKIPAYYKHLYTIPAHPHLPTSLQHLASSIQHLVSISQSSSPPSIYLPSEACPTNETMCLFTTKPTRTYHDSVVDPPRHSSRYSAHTAGVMRMPRDKRSSYRRSTEYMPPFLLSPPSHRSEADSRKRYVDYDAPRRSSRVVEYVEPAARRSRSVVRERDVDYYRGSGASLGEREVVRRSVSRVRY